MKLNGTAQCRFITAKSTALSAKGKDEGCLLSHVKTELTWQLCCSSSCWSRFSVVDLNCVRYLCVQMGLFNFRPSVRPVPLSVHIDGYPGKYYCPRMATMNKPCFQGEICVSMVRFSPCRNSDNLKNVNFGGEIWFQMVMLQCVSRRGGSQGKVVRSQLNSK